MPRFSRMRMVSRTGLSSKPDSLRCRRSRNRRKRGPHVTNPDCSTGQLRQPISSPVMEDVFSVRVKVRGYELDTQGHLNWAEYLHYAEHARWEFLAAAGITEPD